MEYQLTKTQAHQIANDLTPYLIGKTFSHQIYGPCIIDKIEIKVIHNNYHVILIHDVFSKSRTSIPEIYGFRNVAYDLNDYLKDNWLILDKDRYKLD